MDETQLDEQPEAAFQRAQDGYEWRGKPLPYAWSHLRLTAARRLGLLWGMVPEELQCEIKTAEGTITAYDMTGDLAIVLWLCHQDRETCKAARLNPKKFEDDIDDFADASKISGTDERDISAVVRIITDAQNSEVTPTVAGEKGTADPNI